jgi:hypothetical protein
MNRSHLVRLVVATALACIASAPFAQQALEIISLRHRTVDQVLPVLLPLVEPGGTLSGSRGQLFLRASPANVAEIKRALDVIDLPSRRLQILVRLDDAQERERRAVGASGSIGSGGARVDITAADSRRSAGERVDQRLQVLEGGRAAIFTGQSSPYQDRVSGFEVVPRLVGGRVVLEIFQQHASGERLGTTITTQMGEWTEIGGTASDAARDDRGIASSSRTRAAESRRVWVKVEELN